MENIIMTQVEPLITSIINMDQWPLLSESYGDILTIYLKNAQEILEYQYKHLFSSRRVTVHINLNNTEIKLPFSFINKIIKVTYNNEEIPLKYIEINNHYTIKISSIIFNKYYEKNIIIEYEAQGYCTKFIEESIIIKTKKLIEL